MPPSWPFLVAFLTVGLPLGCTSPAADAQPEGESTAPLRDSETLFEEALGVFQRRDYGSALEAFQLVAWSAEKEGDERITVEALAMVARCHSLGGSLAEGRPWLERALDRARPEEPYGWSRSQLVRGIYQRESGDRDGAAETFVALHEYCRAQGLVERAVDAAHHVALVVPLEDQADWGRRAISEAEAAGLERWQAILWNNLGRTYETLEQPVDALHAYRRARDFHATTGGEHEILLADWAVGRAQRLAGELDEARHTQQDVLGRALRRQEREPRRGHLEWVGYARWELGEVAAAQGRRSEALVSLEAALADLETAGLREVWPAGMEELEGRIETLR